MPAAFIDRLTVTFLASSWRRRRMISDSSVSICAI